MSKVTFILGLCGSGKSFYANEFLQKNSSLELIDEGFRVDDTDKFISKYDKLIKDLKQGISYVVIELAYTESEANRKLIVDKILKDAPTTQIEWICFKNDLEAANRNVMMRADRNPQGHININNVLTEYYTYPENHELVEVYPRS